MLRPHFSCSCTSGTFVMPGCRLPPPPPPSKSARGGDHKQERGGLLANWWMSASRFPLLGRHFSNTKASPPPPTRPRIREKPPWERLRQRWGMCICSAGFHSSAVSSIFFLSFFFGGVLWAVRVVNKAPDNRGASSCTCEQPGAQPSSSSHQVYVAVAALLPCYETSEHAALLFFFFFLSHFPLFLHLSERAVTGDGVDTSWVRHSLTHPRG